MHVCVRVPVHEDHRQDAVIEGPPADFTQSTWPHWRWWKWIKDWRESFFLLFKGFQRPPYLNYPHIGLLIAHPPPPHRTLFLFPFSPPPLSTSQSHAALYSYYPAPSYLTRSPSSLSPFPLFPPNPSCSPSLSFIFFLKPTALCLHISPDLSHCQPPPPAPSSSRPPLPSVSSSLHLFFNPF